MRWRWRNLNVNRHMLMIILLGPQVKYEAGRLAALAAPQGKAVAVIIWLMMHDARRRGVG